ncbi:hypothetical protein FSP39_023779 [Pinctada imbricata]|uniref:Uncharacterized protein n=1 Tax=Pinctada imbricata TaxID=66713 RepID=A0AA88YVW4_PINIB|nr:hypothetical protein FSP39_023779 [Pinctada imbricata]
MANNSSIALRKIKLLKKSQRINNSAVDDFQKETRRKAKDIKLIVDEEAGALLQTSEEERDKYLRKLQTLIGEIEISDENKIEQTVETKTCSCITQNTSGSGTALTSDETRNDESRRLATTDKEYSETDSESEEENVDDNGAIHLSVKSVQSKNALSLRIREIVSTPAAVCFNKIYTIEVAEKCPVVALEGRHVWVSYHVDNSSLEEYDFGGKVTYKMEVEDEVRRMCSDGRGRVYMSCRDAQCIKVVDASTNSLSTIYSTEGYPNGIFYDFVQNRLLFSENRGPSYFVYGEYGEEWAKIHAISLSSNEHDVIMTHKPFDLGYISSIALNINGDICIADYINDKACIGTIDGQLKVSYEEFRTKHGCCTVHPYEICCDRSGLVFFACTSGKAIYVLSDRGVFIDKLELTYIPNSICVNDKGLLCIGNMMSPEVEIYSYERKYFST